MSKQAPPYLIEPQPETDQRLSTPVKYVVGQTVIRYKIPTRTYLRIKLYAKLTHMRMGVACLRVINLGLEKLNVTKDPAELIGLAAPPKPYHSPAGKPDKTSPQGS